MAITYGLGFDPFWYIADNVGKPLGGGSMYTFRSLAKTTPKFIYQDPAGLNPWPNPVLFNENGQQGPFFFAIDSANPQESYYIEVYDAAGNLIWNIDQFVPPSASGGGGGTSVINSNNLVINGVFWRNTGSTANPIANTTTLLAPGCHAGLAATSNNAGPDIYFLKNNLTATDQITFPNVTQGTQPLNGDVAPVQYLNYTCSVAGSGETQKCIQIPIIAKAQNLTNISVTMTVWMRANGVIKSVVAQWRTYLGDGATPVDFITPIQTLTPLNVGVWQKFQVTTTVPDITAKTLGACGNDGLFLQLQFPFSDTCNIDIAEPSLFIGSLVPSNSFVLYDQIDGVLNVPRTGDVRLTYSTIAPPGWLLMDDTTIGSGSSVATHAAQQFFPLYNWLYTQVGTTICPISGGASGNAVTDFLANKTLTIPKTLGRVLCEAGAGSGLTARALGSNFGAETHLLALNEMTPHMHDSLGDGFRVFANTPVGGFNALSGTLNREDATTGAVHGQGAQTAFTIVQPTTAVNYLIKL